MSDVVPGEEAGGQEVAREEPALVPHLGDVVYVVAHVVVRQTQLAGQLELPQGGVRAGGERGLLAPPLRVVVHVDAGHTAGQEVQPPHTDNTLVHQVLLVVTPVLNLQLGVSLVHQRRVAQKSSVSSYITLVGLVFVDLHLISPVHLIGLSH